MDLSIETTTGLERRMRIRLPAGDLEAEVASRLKKIMREVRLPGFRPGKVPLHEIRRRFGAGVREEVTGELMQSSFFAAVKKESLRPAGLPALAPGVLEDNDTFEFTATFEVVPDVALEELASIKVKQPVVELNDDEIDAMINLLRKQHRSFEPRPDHKAGQGDRLKLNFHGCFADTGEAFAGGSAENAELILGSGRLLPDFELALHGLAAGDEKTFEMTFPDDYGSEELRGRKVRFEAGIAEVAVEQLPELDENFFTIFGLAEGGLGEFRARVQDNMEREVRRLSRRYLKEQTLDALAHLHASLALPQVMVHEQMHRIQQDLQRQLHAGSWPDQDQWSADLARGSAERRVRLSLVLGRLIEHENLTADPQRVEALLEDEAATYGEPEKVKAWYHGHPEQMERLRAAALEEQVIDRVLEQVQVEDEMLSYDALLAVASPSGGGAGTGRSGVAGTDEPESMEAL